MIVIIDTETAGAEPKFPM